MYTTFSCNSENKPGLLEDDAGNFECNSSEWISSRLYLSKILTSKAELTKAKKVEHSEILKCWLENIIDKTTSFKHIFNFGILWYVGTGHNDTLNRIKHNLFKMLRLSFAFSISTAAGNIESGCFINTPYIKLLCQSHSPQSNYIFSIPFYFDGSEHECVRYWPPHCHLIYDFIPVQRLSTVTAYSHYHYRWL